MFSISAIEDLLVGVDGLVDPVGFDQGLDVHGGDSGSWRGAKCAQTAPAFQTGERGSRRRRRGYRVWIVRALSLESPLPVFIDLRPPLHDVQTESRRLFPLARRLRRRPEARASRIRSAWAAWRCTNGPSRRARSSACMAARAARPASTTTSRRPASPNVGAWILGRNMFGPVRGPWPDESWKGWWGDKPPYHVPVFVLTHHPRAPLEMEGGTTFHFVTDGIHAALERARVAAAGQDVRVGGGVATIRQYLHAGLDRRDAPGDVARAARPRREAVRRHRPARARLRMHAARAGRARDARRADEAGVGLRSGPTMTS